MSASAKIIEFAAPTDPRKALQDERAVILARLEGVQRKTARLGEAAEIERQAFAEIGALGERELADMKAWVAGDCKGARPLPNADARRELNDKLATAIEGNRIAQAAMADVNVVGAELRGRLAEIDGQLRQLVLDRLLTQHAEDVAQFELQAAMTREALAKINSLPMALAEMGRALFGKNGDQDQVRSLLSTAEKMRALRIATAEVQRDEFERILAAETARIEALLK